jgi:LacI family transcriptional regulator
MEEMNLKRIARIAKVDHSTVSRALRGSPVVKPSTRERILEIARTYHYVPNEIARSLKTKKTRIVGLIVSDIKNPFFTEIINATEAYLARNGYNIILCNTSYSVQKEEKFLHILFSRSVDGIILSPTSLEHLHREFFDRYRIPSVLLDVKSRNLVTNSVYVDQELIYRIPQDYDAAYTATRKLLKDDRKVTAIFSLSDFMCIGVYRALQEANLRIPDDIAVLGYDDLSLTRFLRPSLTTVRQPNSEIGNKAAEIVLNNIKDPSCWTPQTVVLKPELIIRESA